MSRVQIQEKIKINVKLEADFPFNVDEALRTGTFISGISGSGKTNTAKLCVQRLLSNNVRVFVFDPSEAWTLNGPIKRIQEIFEFILNIPIPSESAVFDMKRLYVIDQQRFVQNFCKRLFNLQVNLSKPERVNTILVFEEAQLYLPQGKLQAKVAQEILRLISVGRNYGIRIILISQFAANVDKHPIKSCGQKFIGYTDEPNDWDYLSSWINGRKEELASLKIGEFFYRIGNKVEKIQAPLLKSDVKPVIVLAPQKNRKSGCQTS